MTMKYIEETETPLMRDAENIKDLLIKKMGGVHALTEGDTSEWVAIEDIRYAEAPDGIDCEVDMLENSVDIFEVICYPLDGEQTDVRESIGKFYLDLDGNICRPRLVDVRYLQPGLLEMNVSDQANPQEITARAEQFLGDQNDHVRVEGLREQGQQGQHSDFFAAEHSVAAVEDHETADGIQQTHAWNVFAHKQEPTKEFKRASRNHCPECGSKRIRDE